MTDLLKEYLTEHIRFTSKELDQITALFVAKQLKKNEVLHRAGSVCPYMVFVLKGCLRLYSIDDKHVEHNVQFAGENWWITDTDSFFNGGPGTYYIDAIELSDTLLITQKSLEDELDKTPKLERLLRLIYQNGFVGTQHRISAFLGNSAEERYQLMIDLYPDIFHRLPYRHIASYLGIKPESSSRIRRNLMVKSRDNATIERK